MRSRADRAVPGRRAHTFAAVRRMAADLPGVEPGMIYGTPALKVRGKMFACIANHSSAEPDTLVACIGFERRDELLAADPDTYYLKDHYVDYPGVLVRLRRVHPDALRDLLQMAWTFVSEAARGRGAHQRKHRRDSRRLPRKPVKQGVWTTKTPPASDRRRP